MKKVLFVTNLPTPYRIDFYNELGLLCDLTVIVEGRRSNSLHFNWNDESVNTFNILYCSNILNEKKIYWSALKYILFNSYDCLIISTYYTRTQTLLLLLLKILRRKYYFETDGGIINYHESLVIKLVKRLLISGAVGYFSPSNGSDKYLEYYGAKRPLIHRYPFSSLLEEEVLEKPLSKVQKLSIREKLGIGDKLIILSVGQFIYRKGFDILMKSCEGISDEVGIYIIGGTPSDMYLKLKEDLNLQNLHFVGFKNRKELSDYYKCADLFVFPTREDIWGLVINEAMGFGLPVISTNNCVAAIELLPQDCIVPVDDPSSLRKTINNILFDETLLRELSERSIKIIKQGFTSKGMADAHIKVLGE